MRLRDAEEARDGRPVVEENAAAAVDLKVDEARRQERAGRQFDDVRRLAADLRRDDVDDAVVRDDDRRAIAHPLAVEDRIGENRCRHYRVSVTFERLGGKSGSKPRRRASFSIAR